MYCAHAADKLGFVLCAVGRYVSFLALFSLILVFKTVSCCSLICSNFYVVRETYHVSPPPHIINSTIFGGCGGWGEELLNSESLLWFSLQFLCETFAILRRTERDTTIHIFVLRQSNCYSGQILMKLEFSRQIFEKYWNIKFHENLWSGRRVVSCGRTDGQTDKTWRS